MGRNTSAPSVDTRNASNLRSPRRMSPGRLRCFVALLVVTCVGLVGSVVTPVSAAPSPAPSVVEPVGPSRVVNLKLAPDRGIEFGDGFFTSADPAVVEPLNALLGPARVDHVRGLVDPEAPDSVVADALDDYYAVHLESTVDVDGFVEQLQALPEVLEAYARPLPPPPPVTPDFERAADLPEAGADWRGSQVAVRTPGGGGSRVRVVDIEYSWNQQHEDLSKARTALVANGTPSDPFESQNHGTAVAGELVADDNGVGVTGIVDDATLYLVDAANAERGWDIPGRRWPLPDRSPRPSDVILLDSDVGPDGSLAPVE